MSESYRFISVDFAAWLWHDTRAQGVDGMPAHSVLMLARLNLYLTQTLDPHNWQVIRTMIEQGHDALPMVRQCTIAIPLTEVVAMCHVPSEQITIIRFGSGKLVTDINICYPSDLPREIFDELHFELAPHVDPVVKKMSPWSAAMSPLLSMACVLFFTIVLMIFEATRSDTTTRFGLVALFDMILSLFTSRLGVIGIALISALVMAFHLIWLATRLKDRPDVIELEFRNANTPMH